MVGRRGLARVSSLLCISLNQTPFVRIFHITGNQRLHQRNIPTRHNQYIRTGSSSEPSYRYPDSKMEIEFVLELDNGLDSTSYHCRGQDTLVSQTWRATL